MHLLEPSGRKFAELGSGAPPPVEGAVVEEEVEEEGADAAITPETLCQSPHPRHPVTPCARVSATSPKFSPYTVKEEKRAKKYSFETTTETLILSS